VHCGFFYLCHTQGGSHIKASVPINITAMKAITPTAIAITLIIMCCIEHPSPLAKQSLLLMSKLH